MPDVSDPQSRDSHPPQHLARPVSGVAQLASIPGAIIGILVSVQFLQPADSFGRLLLIGGSGAAVGGFSAYFAVYLVQRYLGRRAVWVVGEAILGGLVGLYAGYGLMLWWRTGWFMLLCPLGAIATGLWARRRSKRRN